MFFKLQFLPSKFEFLKEHFGEVQNGFQQKIEKAAQKEVSVEKEFIRVIETPAVETSWLINSSILRPQEAISVAEMTKASRGNLLYRATRDKFTAKSFHSKCDGKKNTLTIVKTNTNFVFGGYTSAKWASDRNYKEDSTAFIFSLRRNGVSQKRKFNIKKPQYAILGLPSYGPIFGSGTGSDINDFYICDSSHTDYGSMANIGNSYECPEGYKFGNKDTSSYLTGSSNRWLTTEIEVYEIN